MGRVYQPAGEKWTTVERRGAQDVTSLVLLPVERGGRTRLSFTRIEPGGVFGPHVDDYEHVFCVQEGHGEVMVGKVRSPIAPGDVIVTEVNEPHGLWAGPDEPLILVAANVYSAP
ncbi:MAG: cupin domain-containing protein [Acidimicrobiales bacterium]